MTKDEINIYADGSLEMHGKNTEAGGIGIVGYRGDENFIIVSEKIAVPTKNSERVEIEAILRAMEVTYEYNLSILKINTYLRNDTTFFEKYREYDRDTKRLFGKPHLRECEPRFNSIMRRLSREFNGNIKFLRHDRKDKTPENIIHDKRYREADRLAMIARSKES